jgi:hypothetical protein
MSQLDLINMEIARRTASSVSLNKSMPDILASIQQFTQLDEMYKANEEKARIALNGIYKESRHYTGKQPIVYTSAQTGLYPYFKGSLDADCNPYFPITQVQSGVSDGLAPLYAAPTKTGTYQRDANFSQIESPIRNTALIALQAYPDITGETSSASHCVGETPSGSGINESLCTSNGGTWVAASYTAGTTATEKLRAALNPWKADINIIIADLYNNTGSTELAFWQNLLSKIDTILSAIQVDVTYPAHTVDFIPNSAPDLARDYLLTNTSSINTHITDRTTFLATQADTQEQVFFGVIKLRLHAANGSFSKLRAAQHQVTSTQSLITDNTAAISSLNLLKVNIS